MEKKFIKINTNVLNITDRDGRIYQITSGNQEWYNCNIMEITPEGETIESGEQCLLTRSEMKRTTGNILEIDKVLEMLHHKCWDEIYTEDDMNFYDDKEYRNLSELENDGNWVMVEFEIVEE